MPIKFGGDPEFFVVNSNGDGVGAFHFFPGTKENPYPLDGGNVQVDGFAVEIGIDPSTTVKEIDDKVRSLVDQCKYFIPKDHSFAFVPYMDFKPDYFAEMDEEHKVIGCDPSWDSLNHEELPPPDVVTSRRRYAGGHIHLGWTEGLDTECLLTRLMVDRMAQTIYSYVGNQFDQAPNGRTERANTRLEEYNIRNSIRHKSYGVELRRPAPYWANPDYRVHRKNLFGLIRDELRYMGVA